MYVVVSEGMRYRVADRGHRTHGDQMRASLQISAVLSLEVCDHDRWILQSKCSRHQILTVAVQPGLLPDGGQERERRASDRLASMAVVPKASGCFGDQRVQIPE